jgi:hypothetical protein
LISFIPSKRTFSSILGREIARSLNNFIGQWRT